MTVPVQTPYNSSTGNGVATVFPFTFKIVDADDLLVTVDGVVKAIGTDYTVSGVGAEIGGSVTFVAAPANGTVVVRASNTLIQRETDYQTNGDFREVVVDADFDRTWLAIRDIAYKINRSIRGPLGDTMAELPAPAGRKNTLVGFDASGNLVLKGDVDLGAVPVSAFMASVLEAVNAADLRADIGGTVDAYVNVKDYGATGDGTTDDTVAIQSAINAAGDSRVIFFPKGNYLVGTLTVGTRNEITMLGAGYRASWLTLKSGTNADMIVFGDGTTYTAGCRVKGLRLNGNPAGNSAGSGIRFRSTEDNAVTECYISGFSDHGILFDGNGTRNSTYLRVLDNYIVGNEKHGIYALNQAYGLIATGNLIAGNGKTPAGGCGILMVSNDGHIISGNLFDENSISVRVFGASRAIIVGNFLQNQDQHGVVIDGASTYNQVIGNLILNPSNGTSNTYAGVVMDDATYNDVHSNLIHGLTVTVSDGVKESGSSNHNDIRENRLRGTITNPIVKIGANSIVKDNTGYKTEGEGTATIASGGTISHGLVATPTSVQVTPRVAGRAVAVTARSSTTFTVSIFDITTNLAIGGTEAVDWRASV